MRAVVIALLLSACVPFSDEGPADMIDVGGASVARGCVLHRRADVNRCSYESGDGERIECPYPNDFEGEIGCCVGDLDAGEPTLRWEECEP